MTYLKKEEKPEYYLPVAAKIMLQLLKSSCVCWAAKVYYEEIMNHLWLHAKEYLKLDKAEDVKTFYQNHAITKIYANHINELCGMITLSKNSSTYMMLILEVNELAKLAPKEKEKEIDQSQLTTVVIDDKGLRIDD